MEVRYKEGVIHRAMNGLGETYTVKSVVQCNILVKIFKSSVQVQYTLLRAN